MSIDYAKRDFPGKRIAAFSLMGVAQHHKAMSHVMAAEPAIDDTSYIWDHLVPRTRRMKHKQKVLRRHRRRMRG